MPKLFEQIKEQAEQLNKAIFKAFNDGFSAGYKKKEEELRIAREKEIEGIYDQHRKEEELEVEVELTN